MQEIIDRILKDRFEKGIETIRNEYERQAAENNRLREELETLRDEKWRDEELERLTAERDALRSNCRDGFSLSRGEREKVSAWQEEHLNKYHPDRYFGAIGGNFTYEFIPTSIGTIGTCICSSGRNAGADSKQYELIFRELS